MTAFSNPCGLVLRYGVFFANASRYFYYTENLISASHVSRASKTIAHRSTGNTKQSKLENRQRAVCVLTKNDHAECDAIKKRRPMPIAPREGVGTPPPLFSGFFSFFGRWARHGCMQPAPTFVSHKQINFGQRFLTSNMFEI